MTARSKKRALNASATGQVPKSRHTITVHVAVMQLPSDGKGGHVTNYALDATFTPLGTSQLMNGSLVYFPPPTPPTKPTVVDAFYCPAWFVVEGLPNRVAFYCEGVKDDDGVGRFRMTRLIVEPSDGGAITDVERLPLSTMLELAYKAAAILAIYYPYDYKGPGHYLNGNELAELAASNFTIFHRRGSVAPLANARNVTAAEMSEIAKRGKGKTPHSRQPRGDDFLKAVAKAYNDTSKDKRSQNLKKVPRGKQAARNLAAAGYTDADGGPLSVARMGAAARQAKAAGYKIEQWRQPKGGKK